MSVSPVIGAAVTSAFTVPEAAGPVPVAVAAGVLAQAARVSLRAASPRVAHHPSTALHPAAATTTAAILTALAVHAAG